MGFFRRRCVVGRLMTHTHTSTLDSPRWKFRRRTNCKDHDEDAYGQRCRQWRHQTKQHWAITKTLNSCRNIGHYRTENASAKHIIHFIYYTFIVQLITRRRIRFSLALFSAVYRVCERIVRRPAFSVSAGLLGSRCKRSRTLNGHAMPHDQLVNFSVQVIKKRRADKYVCIVHGAWRMWCAIQAAENINGKHFMCSFVRSAHFSASFFRSVSFSTWVAAFILSNRNSCGHLNAYLSSVSRPSASRRLCLVCGASPVSCAPQLFDPCSNR